MHLVLRLFPNVPPPPAPPATSFTIATCVAPNPYRVALAFRFAERLLDHEALHSDLTDARYGPLFDRALSQIHQAAQQVKEPETAWGEEQMEGAYARIVADLKADAVEG